MPSTNQLSNNSRSMNGLNTVNANAVYTDNLEVGTLTIDIQGTAPTRITGDNTTNIATTQFVQSAVVGAGSGYVDLTNNQTVGGIKTFSSVPLCSTAPTTGNMLTNKTYVDSVAGGAVSLSGNNTWTGFNQFRQETGVFDGAGNKLSMDVYNSAITSTTGSSSSCNSGGTMIPYNIVVPAGNYCRTVYMRIALDLYAEWPLFYTGAVSLSYTSVVPVITKNGGAYGGSPTAVLMNATSTTKPWTGITVDKFRIKAYLGDILVKFNIDVNNVSTDTYAIRLTLTGSNTSSPSIAVITQFLTDWDILWTATNSQTTGTFGGTNPVYAGSYNLTNNVLQSNADLNIQSTANLALVAPDIQLIADTGYWTAISSGNFYYRTFASTNNLILGSQTALDYFTIGASATGTTFSTTNQPITINSGTATTIISAGALSVGPLATFTNGLTSSALTRINNDLRLTQSTIPPTNNAQLGYTLNATAFPTSTAITNITWTTFGGNVSVPSKGVWLFIGNINIRNTGATTIELMKIVLTATAGSGTPIGTANYIEEGNRSFTGANDPTASMSVQTVFTTTGSATYVFQVYIQMTTANIQTASANPGTWSLTRIG